MIKNRRIGHIGIATNDVARDVEWYVNVLGFEVTGKFQNGNDTVYFLKNDDVIFEIFPSAASRVLTGMPPQLAAPAARAGSRIPASMQEAPM